MRKVRSRSPNFLLVNKNYQISTNLPSLIYTSTIYDMQEIEPNTNNVDAKQTDFTNSWLDLLCNGVSKGINKFKLSI